jgi:Protein of unknown function (DUF3551)
MTHKASHADRARRKRVILAVRECDNLYRNRTRPKPYVLARERFASASLVPASRLKPSSAGSDGSPLLLRLSKGDHMRRTTLGAAAVIAALLLEAVPAFAQRGGYPLYPWCAFLGGRAGSNCYFSTWEQCRAAASGNGGYCYRNSWYDAYGPFYHFGRNYSRY